MCSHSVSWFRSQTISRSVMWVHSTCGRSPAPAQTMGSQGSQLRLPQPGHRWRPKPALASLCIQILLEICSCWIGLKVPKPREILEPQLKEGWSILSVSVCAWVGFTAWEQYGTSALSLHQGAVQEIKVSHLDNKTDKTQNPSGPLTCSISWRLLWLRAPPPERPLSSAVPGNDAALWGNNVRIALSSDEVALWAMMQPAWALRSFLPLHHPPLPATSLCRSWEPQLFGFLCCLIHKPHHFPLLPIAWNPWNRLTPALQ